MCSRSFIDPNYDDDQLMVDFRRNQVFDYHQGLRFEKAEGQESGCGVGVKDLIHIYGYDPELTYGPPRAKMLPPVIPSFVVLEKKVLRFVAYYKETVTECVDEIYRVRPVEIYYYLEDDSIMVHEPRVENSGLAQGKFLRRHPIPKNDIGETYHWKDLNLGCELMFYGRVFIICDADCFTKNFYESEGIFLNDPEPLPKDPYTDRRLAQEQRKKLSSNFNGCRPKSIDYNNGGKKSLRFFCLWDDRESAYGGLKKMELTYFLTNDMVQVKQIQKEEESYYSTLLLHKTKLPKNWKDLPANFPLVCMEPSENEYVEYYGPQDFRIGLTINVFGRRFLIYDMDDCTKRFYQENFGQTDFTPICIDEPHPSSFLPTFCPAPYNGFGSPEDSLQSCLSLTPVRPRQDVVKSLLFETKLLKFGAIMDSPKPEDGGRQFAIFYRLADDMMSVYEGTVQNSGWPGGKFLDFMKIPKPGSSNDCPEYFGLADLYIGSMVDFFGHRFSINCAHPFVYKFMINNPSHFPQHVRENLMEYFESQGSSCQQNESNFEEEANCCDPGPSFCEEPLGEGFFEFLGLARQPLDNKCPCPENPNPCPQMTYDWDTYKKYLSMERHNGQELNFNYRPSPGNPNLFEEQGAQCPQGFSVCPTTTNPYTLSSSLGGIVPPPNQILCDEPQPIREEEYHHLRDHRFDSFNPPTISDEELNWRQKRLRDYCPCPPGGSCQCPSADGKGILSQAPNSVGSCISNCGHHHNNCCGYRMR